MSMKIEGMDKFLQWANQVPKELHDGTVDSVKKRTLEMEANAKSLAPVGETGNLRRSITSEIKVNSQSASGEVHTSGLEYAPYVEFGTSKMSAQPYLTPSHQLAAKGLQSDIEKLFKGLSK